MALKIENSPAAETEQFFVGSKKKEVGIIQLFARQTRPHSFIHAISRGLFFCRASVTLSPFVSHRKRLSLPANFVNADRENGNSGSGMSAGGGGSTALDVFKQTIVADMQSKFAAAQEAHPSAAAWREGLSVQVRVWGLDSSRPARAGG